MKKHFLFWALALGFLPLAAQQYSHPLYKQRADVVVKHNNQPLQNAWAGGFNTPQFSTLDLNFDNVPDLFVYDRSHNKITTYLAVQTAGQWGWKHAPEYESTFPTPIYLWARTVDFDFDGLKDLFCYTPGGVQVFRNVSTPATGMKWEVASPRLEFGNNINIYVTASDIAAFDDIDNDGDIDVLNVEGAMVSYYRNMSMETNGVPGLSPFIRETDAWGNFRECDCENFIFGNLTSCRSGNEVLHSGNALLAIDLNNDNVKDIIWGDIGCTHLTMLMNQGTPTNALMQSYTNNFPSGTTPVNFQIFPAAYYEDVNFDGKKDLIAAPNVYGTTLGDSIVDFGNSAWLYTNVGTAQLPVFDFEQTNFLQDGMIDRGDGSTAAFADIDADGDLDMLVGNYFGQTNNGVRATLALYTNQGTATTPVFALTDPDFLDLSSQHFINIKPIIADVDQDGKKDLVITSTGVNASVGFTGRVRYFLNTAAAGSAMTFGPMQTLAGGATDNVDDIPCFVDIDQDGKQDLLVGTSGGAIKHYRNTGSNATPVYELITGTFGGIIPDFFRSRIFPVVADADNNGRPDLITADDSGAFRIYPDFLEQQGDLVAAKNLVLNDVVGSRITANFGRYLTIAAADLDGDNLPELVLGNKAGGLQLLSADTIVNFSIVISAPEPLLQVNLYPNPANDLVTLEAPVPVAVQVTDVLGRPVLLPSETKTVHHINTSYLSQGVYFFRVQSADGRFQVKRVVVSR